MTELSPTDSLRDKLIRKGWVSDFNADTLVALMEEHYAALPKHKPTTNLCALCADLADELTRFNAWYIEDNGYGLPELEALLRRADSALAAAADQVVPSEAVMIAATNGNANVVNDPVYKQCIAAAIRAVADQVVPDKGDKWTRDMRGDAWTRWEERKLTRAELLAIAAELDGGVQ